MSAEQHLRDGNLDQALAALQDQVKKQPAEPKHRIFLFQLLSVLGDWDRALTQLNVARDMDPATLPMVQTYREALRCEVLRAGVFSGGRSPMIFGEPEQWVALLMQSLKLVGEGNHAQSAELRDRAFEEAPATPGVLVTGSDAADHDGEGEAPGREFAWVADADMRLGPIVEAVLNGRYYWIPFHRIRRLHVEEPADLRDVVWMPAHFEFANGGESVALIPTRYPGSEKAEDDLHRLARKTDWVEHEGGLYLGLGQRMLATDEGEFPLMDVRELRLEVEDVPDASAGEAAGES